MLFNSLTYALYLPIVFLLYWFVFGPYNPLLVNKAGNARGDEHTRDYPVSLQNLLIVVASYVFYGWWDWRFLILIFITTLCSFGSGLLISHVSASAGRGAALRKFALWGNIVLNLGILATFKYYNFFATQFAHAFGFSADHILLNVILPVGISFYTFQALSYTIDVYRGKISATRDVVAFFAFISFFPQLVAGPIERATNLLPQFLQPRRFDYGQAVDGMRLILWGLFKKMVVADNCATYVDMVFADYANQSASTLLLGAVFFTFQIYGDFSGYSDIAIGTARLFGIRLMRNFNVPYFSRDIAEFWRRWHISLTTWFRDYVYIPLGGSRPEIPDGIRHPEAYKKMIVARNTFIIFLLSGFWHGTNWTFIVWGLYHALLFMPLILLGKNRKYTDTVACENGIQKLFPSLKELSQMLLTFMMAVIGWIIFRAENIRQAWEYFCAMFDPSLFAKPIKSREVAVNALMIIIMLIIEFSTRNGEHGLDIKNKNKIVQMVMYIFIYLLILFFCNIETIEFIYFQF